MLQLGKKLIQLTGPLEIRDGCYDAEDKDDNNCVPYSFIDVKSVMFLVRRILHGNFCLNDKN
jgi:hypothetical protein